MGKYKRFFFGQINDEQVDFSDYLDISSSQDRTSNSQGDKAALSICESSNEADSKTADSFSPQPGGIVDTDPSFSGVPQWLFEENSVIPPAPVNQSIEFDPGSPADPDYTHEIDGWDTLLDD